MQSILVINPVSEKREEEASRLCREEQIDHFDISYVERADIPSKSDVIKKKQSIGIDAVKAMQKSVFLKPFRGKKKAVIIKDAHLLTTEAQNALLKVLEEPPPNTILILTAEDDRTILPTVISRCRVISLPETISEVTDVEKESFRPFLTVNADLGLVLKEAESLKNKEQALLWLERYILTARSELLQLVPKHDKVKTLFLITHLKQAQTLRNEIRHTNVNLRLAIENFLLS